MCPGDNSMSVGWESVEIFLSAGKMLFLIKTNYDAIY
jgi:hypothetical protein